MTGGLLGPDGKPQKFESTTETKDKNHIAFKMYMIQPDGTDQLAFTIEYTQVPVTPRQSRPCRQAPTSFFDAHESV